MLVIIKIILCEGTVTVKSRSASVVYNTTLKIVDILKRHVLEMCTFTIMCIVCYVHRASKFTACIYRYIMLLGSFVPKT